MKQSRSSCSFKWLCFQKSHSVMNLLGSWLISREEKFMLYKYIEISKMKNTALWFLLICILFDDADLRFVT